MDDGLKQRFVGALVLLALAIIFVPVIFDRERITPVDRESMIPPAPYFGEGELSDSKAKHEIDTREENATDEASATGEKLAEDLAGTKSVDIDLDAGANESHALEDAIPKAVPTPERKLSKRGANKSTPTVDNADDLEEKLKEEMSFLERVKKAVTDKAAGTLFIPDKNDDKADLEQEPATYTEEGLPQAWVLQVASFKSKDRAEVLKDKLLKDGLPAYVREVKGTESVMSRVYVGPKLSRSAIIENQEQIRKKYKLETLLLKYRS